LFNYQTNVEINAKSFASSVLKARPAPVVFTTGAMLIAGILDGVILALIGLLLV
jgi:hypothetical protein